MDTKFDEIRRHWAKKSDGFCARGVDRYEKNRRDELVTPVREKLGPVAAFELLEAVRRLPRARSGKVLRGTMRYIADVKQCKQWMMPTTIEDPADLEEVSRYLTGLGYARGNKVIRNAAPMSSPKSAGARFRDDPARDSSSR